MRPSLATDHLSWLVLTHISFVVDHRWTFRSIIDIAIDSTHIGRRIFSMNLSGARCLQPEYIGHCISLIIVLLSSSRGVQSCLLLYLSHHFICFVLMNDNNYSHVYFFIFTIRFQNFTFIVLLNTIVIWFIYLWIMLLYIANRFNENKHKWITSPVWLITCLMMRASSYKKSSKLTPPSVHDFIQQIIVIYQQPSSTRALHVGPQHDCQQQRSVVWK